jgi:hypothetical protein
VRVRVNFTISGEDGDSVLAFANTVNHPVDKIAKIALIHYINNVLKKAEEMAKEVTDGTQLHPTGITQTPNATSDSQALGDQATVVGSRTPL